MLSRASFTSHTTAPQARGTLVVIPNKANRVNLYPFDAEKYKTRNVVERSIGRIKDFRAIATRYDKAHTAESSWSW